MSATDVTLYSRPNCQPCKATGRKLEQLGVVFAKIDVTQDPDALDYIKSLGYLQAPVVVAGGDHWSGYKPDLLKRLAADVENEYQDED